MKVRSVQTSISSLKTNQDISGYEGPDSQAIINSNIQLISGMARDLGIHLNLHQIGVLNRYIEKFVTSFAKAIQNFQDGLEVERFANQCKNRREDLLNVVNSCVSSHGCLFPQDLFLIDERSDKVFNLDNLRYIPDNFSAYAYMLREYGEVISYIELAQPPRFYIYLYRLFFTLCSFINVREEEFRENIEKYSVFLMLPVSLAQIYEHLNPTPEVTQEYGNKFLELLTREAKDPSDKFWKLAKEVKKDIESKRPLPYVKEVARAIKAVNSEVHTYSDSDYYLSAKASNVRIYKDQNGNHSGLRLSGKSLNKNTWKTNSLYSSVIEYDPLLGNPLIEEFDKKVGYVSNYILSLEVKNVLSMEFYEIITMMIPNPGKYKPRGIHVGCNAIQDRCKFLHRYGERLLNMIPSNCMDDHYKGVRFLKKVTDPEYRKQALNNIFVSDFTNATDTINQDFQCFVLEVFFPDHPEYANLWRVLSTLPKYYLHPVTGELIPYTQMTGQPQGLLFSFDAFSMAHLFIILMIMKFFQMVQTLLSAVLAIVGDDSVVSYPAQYETDEARDKFGFTLYEFHSWLCDQISLIKNDSKSGKSFFTDINAQVYTSALLDFAKVTVFEGRLMTPLPYGLLASYSEKPGVTDIQAILWLGSKEVYFKTLLYNKILTYYATKPYQLITACAIISSGLIPLFKGFEDSQLYSTIPSDIAGCAVYYYYRQAIVKSFLGKIMSEKIETKSLDLNQYIDKSVNILITDFEILNKVLPYVEGILSSGHKYNIMVRNNLDKIGNICDILQFKGDIETASTAAAIFTDEKYESLFNHILTFDKHIADALHDDSEEIWQFFSYQTFEEFKEVRDPLSNFQIKSMKKETSNIVKILANATKASTKVMLRSSYLKESYEEQYDQFLDHLISITGEEAA